MEGRKQEPELLINTGDYCLPQDPLGITPITNSFLIKVTVGRSLMSWPFNASVL